ncbi:MAG TPA: hypothetical protein VFZ21_10605 [Gemmatimonadaceae bacterium]|nr:hypothetical protein [Gemmatimonadaceae bacterium]
MQLGRNALERIDHVERLRIGDQRAGLQLVAAPCVLLVRRDGAGVVTAGGHGSNGHRRQQAAPA